MTTQISETNIQAATLAALSPVTITSITVTNSSWTPLDDSAVSTSGGYIVITGANFASGCNVIISSTNATSVTFVNSTTLRVQVPAMSAGTYVVYVVNPNGTTAIIVNGLTYSGTPTWVTTSPLPQGTTGVAISIQLSATGDAPLTYALQAGSSLPAGLTLSSSGLLSGTVSGLTSETTYNFTIEAIDAQSQESPKAFAITIIAGDQYWDYVSLLLPGTTSTSIFNDDASTNNYNITITGDTRPSNLGPYTPGYYSNFFDGNGDYLRVSSTGSGFSSLNVFTYECWIYPTAALSTNCIFDISESTPFRFVLSSTNVTWQGPGGGTILTANFTWVLGAWHHVAFVDDGTNISIFINGTRYATTTYGSWGSTGANGVNIGCNRGDTWFFPGYISNARFVKGTAIYDPTQTTITVPSTPLTAVSGTSLLTCQSNRFIDNSADNLTVTRNGDVTVNSFDPFVPSSSYASIGSTYFDGSGDYLSTVGTPINFGTGNFTIEWWVYRITSQGGDRDELPMGGVGGTSFMLGMQAGTLQFGISGTSWNITSSITVPLSVWAHCAIARVGSTVTMYINGVSAGTATMSTNFTGATAFDIGRRQGASVNNIQVYCSNLRIVNGTAVYTGAFTPPTSPLTAVAGTSLLTCQTNQSVDNSDFLDSGTNNVVITRNGNTTQGTFSPYAENWSNYFDGNGDYLTSAYNANIPAGTGDFTIEAWVYMTAAFAQNDSIASIVNDWQVSWNAGGFCLMPDGSTRLANTNALATMTTEQWYHVAFARQSGTLRSFLNGTLAASASSATNFNDSVNGIRVGVNRGTTNYFTGYISNLRYVKGTAVYTSNFTSPTAPLQPIANTSLLTCRDSGFVDDSANRFTITRNGDVTVQKFGPFAGTTLPTPYYGAYFDGTGDYLTFPNSSAFTFGTGDFTIEAWVNLTSTSSRSDLIGAAATGSFDMQLTVPTNLISFGRTNTAYDFQTTYAFVVGQWTHVAIARASGTIRCFVNGVLLNSAANTINYSQSGGTGSIGAANATEHFLNGYISNLRVVKGQALYTTTFTPSTTPLTTTSQGATASNVSLLTCQSATFIDNSTNNFAITAVGNSQPTFFNPFTITYSTLQSYSPSVFGGSMYFDGNGDYLTYPNSSLFAFGTGSFTIEFWINGPLNNDKFILGGRAAIGTMHITTGGFSSTAGVLRYVGSATIVSSKVITDNTWHHCAIVRNGSTAITLYVDGVAVGTGSDSTNYTTTSGTWNLGKNDSGDTGYLTGYISDLRVIRGQALYTSNFVPSNIPLTAVQNTVLLLNGTAGGIIDVSSNNDFETVADAKLSVVQSKWSNTSMYFDGTGDYLINRTNTNLYGAGLTFTAECWIYLTNTGITNGIMGCWNPATGTTGWSIVGTNTGKISVYFGSVNGNSTFQYLNIGSMSANTWTHIAFVRYQSGTDNVMRFFINGVSVLNNVDGLGNATRYTGSPANGNPFVIGGAPGISSGRFTGTVDFVCNGYMQDVRISNGVARYTNDFAVPTSPFITN
jgi:hypothetical protein